MVTIIYLLEIKPLMKSFFLSANKTSNDIRFSLSFDLNLDEPNMKGKIISRKQIISPNEKFEMKCKPNKSVDRVD